MLIIYDKLDRPIIIHKGKSIGEANRFYIIEMIIAKKMSFLKKILNSIKI